ncbi:MAG: GAF domain-containing sensor histidine kinase [Candidatus Promineifilaceae bacterium]|nr:GAF domain-containing sensor histidine kinase [Candidatus Promineifilaceae bacterium]
MNLPLARSSQSWQQSPATAPHTRLAGPRLWIVRAAWLLVLLLVAGMLSANLPHLVADTRAEWQVRQAASAAHTLFPTVPAFVRYVVMVKLVVAATFAGTALFIAWRQPDDWMVLYTSATLLLLVYLFGFTMDVAMIRYPQFVEQLFPAIRMVVPTLITACLIGFFFLFPDGRFYPRWSRWLALLAVLVAAFFFAGVMGLLDVASSSRLASLPEEWPWLLFTYSLVGTLIAGFIGRLHYYRHTATRQQRQQIKLVLLGLGAIISVPLLQSLLLAVLDVPSRSWRHFIALNTHLITPIVLPLTIGMSVLRYRLWQVERLVNRTLVFGALTVLVSALYVLVVGVLSLFFQASGNLWLAVGATGLVAIVVQPLRRRLQAGVNRLMYGERDDPVTVLSQMGKRLEEAALPGEILSRLVETLAQTLRLPYVAIEVEERVVAVAGTTRAAPAEVYPLVYRSQLVGRLVVAARSAGEIFGEDEARLLRNAARQAGAAVYAEQLTQQLQRSRERLVATREEERRRLRRDLHDGLGPRLATLAVRVSAAQNLLRSDPDAAAALLAQVRTESQEAITEVRRVVEGLRPAALDQLGLTSALREFATRNGTERTRIHVQAPDSLPPLPAAVEVAAYRIATEAITNTLRHAHARHCRLRLEVDGALRLTISDDGRGLAAESTAGVGIASMRERALEVGGTFDLASKPHAGTIVTVHLPLVRTE